MSETQNRTFVRSLTDAERRYLWEHVYRYVGVEGTTVQDQFNRLVEYVLNFLTGESDIEQAIFAKAMTVFGS